MKKILFLIFTSCSIAGLYGQGVNFGAKAGLNASNFTNNDDFNTKIGLHFGAVANIYISEKFSFQPELFYSAQGYNSDFNGQDVRAKIDYFNLPFLVDYKINDNISLQVGPQIGFNIRSEITVENQENVSAFVNDIDMSASFGLQYKFDSGFFTQARYVMGINDVSRTESYKNSVISLSIGFFFNSFVEQEEN